MKPTINLYFKFAFTGLSPDAMPISLGIVSDESKTSINSDPKEIVNALSGKKNNKYFPSKSFYSEFSDFDINRCDDWVKKNVISKLKLFEGTDILGLSNEAVLKMLSKSPYNCCYGFDENKQFLGHTSMIKKELKKWLSQFSNYNSQFVCDCGTLDWYCMLQLLAEWDEKENKDGFNGNCPMCGLKGQPYIKIGLPKLPENISPIPFDLNDLIAIKYNTSAWDAFKIDRELEWNPQIEVSDQLEYWGKNGKHNALWDAKVIKEIYQKLKQQAWKRN